MIWGKGGVPAYFRGSVLGDRLAWEENGEQVDIDGLGLTEEIEEDFHAFGGGGDRDDGAAHALEGAVGDLDFLADLEDRADRERFGVVLGAFADILAEGFDEGFRYAGDFGAEADEATDALAEGHRAFHFREVEFCEQVAGEERFDPPDFATSGGLAVAEAGAEHLDAFEFLEVFGGDVFPFGLRADAEPAGDVLGGGVHWPRIR